MLLSRWTADHERDAFLFRNGQDRDNPEIVFFVLLLEGAKFQVSAREVIHRTQLGYELFYSIESVSLITGKSRAALSIHELLKEAMTVNATTAMSPQKVSFDF
jgi:hypothetical protein